VAGRDPAWVLHVWVPDWRDGRKQFFFEKKNQKTFDY
jgi:hypothetical protein